MVFRKVLFMWWSMSISSFIGHTLTELFGKKLTIDDKYINKRVWFFIHQTKYKWSWEEKIVMTFEVHTSKWLFNYFQKMCSRKIKSCWLRILTLHEKNWMFQNLSEASENVNLFVSLWRLVFFAVCIYIQYLFDVVRNKLQTINIY